MAAEQRSDTHIRGMSRWPAERVRIFSHGSGKLQSLQFRCPGWRVIRGLILSLPMLSVQRARAELPERFAAPYVQVSNRAGDFVAASRATGQKYFTLAFIVADKENEPAWSGVDLLDSKFGRQMKTRIDELRGVGGDVIVSFGGAGGKMIDLAATDADALAAMYRQVIDLYQLAAIDLDIEGSALDDAATIERRSIALAKVQSTDPKLRIIYTLPASTHGLEPSGIAAIKSAIENGVRIDHVNLMTMDYGDRAAPNPGGHMGDYAIKAANGAHLQLKKLFPTLQDAARWKLIGLTSMIGVNDVKSEIFTPADAKQLVAFGNEHAIGGLSFWSLNRDCKLTTPIDHAVSTSSGIVQDRFEFTNIVKQFGASAGPTSQPSK